MNFVNYDPTTRQIVWTTSELDPGWAGSINFQANVPPGDVGRQGRVYLNTAEITLPGGDVSPVDNSATDTAWTGPDLFVHTSLWSGKLKPGEVVTFMVDFGNGSNGAWSTGMAAPGSPGVYITDTLPAGLTFLSATDPFAPFRTWTPRQQEGNRVGWSLDGLCANCRLQFQVTARIGQDFGGKDLVNTIEIVDVAPGDVDPFPGNNAASWTGRVQAMVYLPVLRK